MSQLIKRSKLDITADTFFISDHHFQHDKIIKFSNRPFKDLDDMREELIRRHNSVVGKDDIVYFLGDFILKDRSLEKVKDIVQRLNGYKVLVMGNHDTKEQLYLDAGFEKVYPYGLIVNDIVISHEPINLGGPIAYNIHGHIHGEQMLDLTGKHFDCSAEAIDYIPVKFEHIIKKMKYHEDDKHVLLVMRGMPGVGKSTFIKEQGLDQMANVISPDQIRLKRFGVEQIPGFGPQISQKCSGLIQDITDNLVENSIRNNKITVLDITCTKLKLIKRYVDLARFYNINLQIIDFSDVSIETAKERNKNREPEYIRVPEEVIDRMYKDMQFTIPKEYEKYIVPHTLFNME